MVGAGFFQWRRIAFCAQNSMTLSKVLRALDGTTASTKPRRHTEMDWGIGTVSIQVINSSTFDQKSWIARQLQKSV